MIQIIYIYFLIAFGFNVYLCFEDAWYSYQSDLKDASREELVITNVTTDENFKSNSKVRKWTSLSVGPVCYTVGLMDTGLTLLLATLNSEKTAFNITSKIIDLNKSPRDVILLQNRKHGVTEIVAVVSFYEELELIWYNIQGIDLNEFWTWKLKQPLVHINNCQIKGKNVLLLANDYYQNVTTIDLYEYNIKGDVPNYWLRQSLHLSSPPNSSAFNNFQQDFYLSIPQKSLNLVIIYKYEESHFVAYNNISSEGVDIVTSFEMGFKSFLAINGYNAGIYRFTRNRMVREDIVNSNLGGIHYWLPIPVDTYKDEVILFAQRTVDHTTHKAYVIDIFTSDGRKFEEHEDIPCSYFGEHAQWLTCLTHGSGIIGSNYISIGDKLGLIVPRMSDFSILFMVQFTIKQTLNPKEKEIQMLVDVKEKLKQMIDSQNKEYEKVMNRYKQSPKKSDSTLSSPHSTQQQNEGDIQLNEKLNQIGLEIQELKEKVNRIVEKENRKEFNTVTINGIVEMKGASSKFKEIEVEKIKGFPATDLLDDIVRKDSIRTIPGKKTFTDLEVDDLTFAAINGIDSKEIVMRNDSSITLIGNLTFNKPSIIKSIFTLNGKINDIDLENGIINVQEKFDGDLEFDKLKIEQKFRAGKINNLITHSNEINYSSFNKNLNKNYEIDAVFIPQNISVININGEHLNSIINQLCLINIKCYIPGDILINGNVIAQRETFTQYLNDLKFPEEYILQDSVPHANITGLKTFTNSLTAKEIRSRGTIDGLNSQKLITLSTDQVIPGKIVFKDIEVTKELNVSGNIFGEFIDMFLPNPTLQFVSDIKSNVNFKNLEVDGDIIVESNFNGNNLDAMLQDLVYKDEEIVKIESLKDFPEGFTVKDNLRIGSNSINNIKLDLLVSKDADETLDIHFLKGDVSFKHVFIKGSYGGKNVTQMEQELVKLTGEQYISSTLIFNEAIDAENFEIMGKLNDLEAEEYLYADGDREIATDLRFDYMEVENISVDGNLRGNLAEIDLNDFSDRYLSYSKDQIVDHTYNISFSTIDNLNADRINGVNYDGFLNYGEFAEKLKNLLEEGKFGIENLRVNGSIQIQRINGRNMSDWLPKNLLKEYSQNKKEFSLQGDLYVNTMEISKLSGVTWEWFINQLYFKDDLDPVFNSTKNFTKGFKVNKLVETDKLNGIPIENILTKEGRQDIKSPVIIKGDVVFNENITISQNLNAMPLVHVLDKFNVFEDAYVIKGDLLFRRLPYIHNLTVRGHVNNKNTTDILLNLVYIDEDFTLHSDTTFERCVNVSGNFAVVQNISNINFSDIAPRIVLTTKDTEIQGPISFSQAVFIRRYLNIENDLTTRYLYNFDLNEWKKNAVFVDRGLLFGNYTFEKVVIKDDLTIKFLNDTDMNFLIPLRSNQSLPYLEFNEITAVNNIDVGNLVNGYKLPDEFEKTVMVDLDQRIFSNIIFEEVVLVRKTLSAPAINDKAASEIVTTDTDQTLTSVFNFNNSKTRVESDLLVHGLINDINISRWRNNSLKIYSPKVQKVYDDWNVTKNITFNENIKGDSFISDLDLRRLMNEVEEKKSYKYNIEHAIIEDYKSMCTDINYLYEYAKRQIYKFKYFEELQTLTFTNHVQHIHYFQHMNNHYLLVNEFNCSSHLMTFNSTAFYPSALIETGHISQVASVYVGETLYLVTRGDYKKEKCKIEGTNVWHFDEDNLMLEYKVEHQNQLQESLVPGTFYGLNEEGVIEFKIIKNNAPRKYRKWNVNEENAAFVPRGLKTRLALRTGQKIIFLDRTDPFVEDVFNPDTESIIIGNTTEIDNYFIPGKFGGDLVVTSVGIESAKKNLLAVATHEETSVRGRLDFIKVYENPLTGELFHKIPTYKPSSLVSIEFNQGETLLAFMENKRTLQVYEYKGIEGFKHRTSAKIKGSKLFLMTLPIEPFLNPRKVIGIIHENKISVIQSVMLGNPIRGDLKCGL